MRRRFILQENKVAFDYNDYLTIEALEDDCYVIFTNDIEYGIDGIGWKQLPAHAKSPIIRSGQTISFRGELEPTDHIGIGKFKISKKCNLKGNIMSMLFGDNAANNYSLIGKNYAFCNLFYNCAVINTNNLSLPATVLERNCYYYMFEGCTSLTTAPELHATTLAETCYSGMFYGCTSLTTAPELPATTLASFCDHSMFYGCTSLTTAPELPATTLKDFCYSSMFYGCSKLNYIKMLATNISASYCLNSWVLGVSSTGTFVKNAAMTSLPTGSNGIPSGWTVQNA